MNDRIMIDGVVYVKESAQESEIELKTGRWYLAKDHPERGAGQLKETKQELLLIYHPGWKGGHNGLISDNDYKGNHCGWYLSNELIETTPLEWTPQKGDPIFVWDDYDDEELPCNVKYYHSEDKYSGKINTCSTSSKDGLGAAHHHCCKFDPKLIGVPRKDWPPETLLEAK